jgi:hypothetical protein
VSWVRHLVHSGAVAVSLLAIGCSAAFRQVPDLGGLYDRAAQADDSERNPVIVIPGILGSKLYDERSDRVVWGAFAGLYANPMTADGARLVALPMREGAPLAELTDGVVPRGVLDRVRVSVLGLPFEQQAYLYILATLGVGGYRDQTLGSSGVVRYSAGHFTCFQFDYDWRRDNAENARRLGEFIAEKKAYVEAELRRRYGRIDRPVKFNVIAHSMGGLLLRYYLRYGSEPLRSDGALPPITWAGAADVEKAVLVATPNAGSVQAFRQLVDGASFSFILPTYPPAVLGTMPSIYELLPRTRHQAIVEPSGDPIDVFDPGVWERHGWGLLSPSQDAVLRQLLPDAPTASDRRRIAVDHLRKVLARARQFQAALDVPASPPAGLSLYLFAGDAEKTPAVVEASEDGVRVRAYGPGDETVLRTSAVMDERVGREWRPGLVTPVDWSGVTFVVGDHLAVTRNPSFTDNVLYRLLEAPRAMEVGSTLTKPPRPTGARALSVSRPMGARTPFAERATAVRTTSVSQPMGPPTVSEATVRRDLIAAETAASHAASNVHDP